MLPMITDSIGSIQTRYCRHAIWTSGCDRDGEDLHGQPKIGGWTAKLLVADGRQYVSRGIVELPGLARRAADRSVLSRLSWQAVISQLDAVAGRCCSCSVALTGRMLTIAP
jgi:hypothetical protein